MCEAVCTLNTQPTCAAGPLFCLTAADATFRTLFLCLQDVVFLTKAFRTVPAMKSMMVVSALMSSCPRPNPNAMLAMIMRCVFLCSHRAICCAHGVCCHRIDTCRELVEDVDLLSILRQLAPSSCNLLQLAHLDCPFLC